MLTNEVRHELIRAVSDRVRMALSTEEGRADFEKWYQERYGRPYKQEERKDETPCFTS